MWVGTPDRFINLSPDTPALRDRRRTIRPRHVQALAEAVAAERGRPADDLARTAPVHLVPDGFSLAVQSADPARMIGAAFAVVEPGRPPASRSPPASRPPAPRPGGHGPSPGRAAGKVTRSGAAAQGAFRLPSGWRTPVAQRSCRNFVGGKRTAAFSSRSTPQPGASEGARWPSRTTGVPGKTSWVASL